MAVEDVFDVPDALLEAALGVATVAGEGDVDEGRDVQPAGARVDVGGISGDDARLLQQPYTAQAGRRRQVYPLRQLQVCKPAVALQLADDLAILGINCSHGSPDFS